MNKKRLTILGGTIEMKLTGANAFTILGTTDKDITLEYEKDEKILYTNMSGGKAIFAKSTRLTSVILKGEIGQIDQDIFAMAFGGTFKERVFKKDETYFDGTKVSKEKKVSVLVIGEEFNKIGEFWYKGINKDPNELNNPRLFIPNGDIAIVNAVPLSSNEIVTFEFIIQSHETSAKDKPMFILEPK